MKKDVMKNAASKRTMPLIPEIKEALLKLKAEQDKNKAYFSNYYNQEYLDYVWVDEIGMIVNPNSLTNHFQKFLEQHGLPKIRFHELRHSCASLLLACGVSMKEIQEWLGHSTISTTVNNQYGHIKFKFEFKQPSQCKSKSRNLLTFFRTLVLGNEIILNFYWNGDIFQSAFGFSTTIINYKVYCTKRV